MKERIRLSSGTRWEPLVGYSRAVRVGSQIAVSGTTPTDANGNLLHPGDPYRQTVQTIANLRTALEKLGSGLQDVIRTRIYVKRISDWQEIGRAHAEAFGEIRPATSMVEVSRLISDEILVEIEADAITE